MKRRRRKGLKHGLHETLVDDCWEELSAVFDDPKVRQARRTFLRSIVEAMARRDGGR